MDIIMNWMTFDKAWLCITNNLHKTYFEPISENMS